MSTSDQPATPPLTRRRLREIRHTGATPVVSAEAAEEDALARQASGSIPVAPETSGAAEPSESEPVVDEPSESEPAAKAESESGPAPEAAGEDVPAEASEPESSEPENVPADENADAEEPAEAEPVPAVAQALAPEAGQDLGVTPLTRRQAREHERIRTASVPIIAPDHVSAAPEQHDDVAEPVAAAPSKAPESAPAIIVDVPGAATADTTADEVEQPRVVVNPHLGAGLLEAEPPIVQLPPSFDQLIARNASASGSTSTPNALILSQTPSAAPLVAPVTATGEVLITGSFDLPEGLGSMGHAPGVHDGKDVDAVLVDGELPAASSPTPIAASAAISTVRTNDEIIRPPAPEKGSRLVVALAITAGALLVTVAGLLVLAFTTGAL
ncbi:MULTISPECIES: hypothetical protein [unclassified Microbacterium]|uniref:hypothetical protein n=1 Tax=unclassified Microbacterium TaxID=2609290 RepID=UPI0037462FD5